MVPKDRLTKEQAEKLGSLSKEYPKTGRAYRIVAAFDDFYKCATTEEASFAFGRLCSWMHRLPESRRSDRSRLEPMKEAAATLLRHKENILAYFRYRFTNAICLRINSMIQAAKRKARGFNTFKGFASMIYLIDGKLELAVPHPFKST